MKVKMEELEKHTACVKSFNMNAEAVSAKCKAEPQLPRQKKRHRPRRGSNPVNRKSIHEASGASATSSDAIGEGMAQLLKKNLRIEHPQLTQKLSLSERM